MHKDIGSTNVRRLSEEEMLRVAQSGTTIAQAIIKLAKGVDPDTTLFNEALTWVAASLIAEADGSRVTKDFSPCANFIIGALETHPASQTLRFAEVTK